MSISAVDRLLRDQTARTTQVSELRSDLRVQATGRRSTPGSTTIDEVDAARKALTPHQSGAGVELISVGRKKVFLHVEKLAGARVMALTSSDVKPRPSSRRRTSRPWSTVPFREPAGRSSG